MGKATGFIEYAREDNPGTGRVRAEEIDNVIGGYIHPSALLCTDTATNYKKFAKIKGLQHETVNERQKQRVKKEHKI